MVRRRTTEKLEYERSESLVNELKRDPEIIRNSIFSSSLSLHLFFSIELSERMTDLSPL